MALSTTTNQRPRLKQVRMEVRFVTAASRGIFFLSLGGISGFAAQIRSFATKKKPSGTQGKCRFENIFKMDLLVAKWRAKNKSYVSQKHNHAWKTHNCAELCRNWLKFRTLARAVYPAKFEVFKLSRSRYTAHFKLQTSEPESMMILRFLGFSGRGLSLKLLVLWSQNCLKFKMAPRDFILWLCCTWTTTYWWIFCHIR